MKLPLHSSIFYIYIYIVVSVSIFIDHTQTNCIIILPKYMSSDAIYNRL